MADDEESQPLDSTPGENAAEIGAAVASVIPYAGGPISNIVQGVIRRRQNRRLKGFFADLREDLEHLEGRVNEDFVQTEEFNDLAEEVFERASRERQQEQLDALRAVFLNAITGDRPSYSEVAEITQLISDWQPRHVVLLRILADPVKADEEAGRPVGDGSRVGTTSLNSILSDLLPKWTDDQIGRTWQDLHDAQLVSTSSLKTMMTDKGIHQLEGRLTNWGKTVASYLRNPADGR